MTHGPIDFYFDLSSPYSYIASEWIAPLAAHHGRMVRWHSILTGVTFKAAGLKPNVDYPIKGEYALHDFARSARFAGLEYRQPHPFPIATQNAARVFWWLRARSPERAEAWAQACMRAYFRHNIAINDAEQLKLLATAQSIDPAEAEAVWNDPEWKDKLRLSNDAAIANGVFGAPFFIVDGERFWGNDRRPQLERFLSGDTGFATGLDSGAPAGTSPGA